MLTAADPAEVDLVPSKRAASAAATLVRTGLASPFLISGLSKAVDLPAATAEMSSLGLWYPPGAAVAVILTQLAGGLLLLSRRGAQLGAAILAIFTAAATLIAHPFWSVSGAEQIGQLVTFCEHVAIVAGLGAAAILSASQAPPRRGPDGARL
jgi:uncharacterized membrane protein YphA (DoxX/SURF4 family)